MEIHPAEANAKYEHILVEREDRADTKISVEVTVNPEGETVHLSSFSPYGMGGTSAYLTVKGIDGLIQFLCRVRDDIPAMRDKLLGFIDRRGQSGESVRLDGHCPTCGHKRK